MSEQSISSMGLFARRVRKHLRNPGPKRVSTASGESLGLLLVAFSYYLAVVVSLQFRIGVSTLTAFWPANAILLTALILTPRRRWWRYLLAVVPAHLLASSAATQDTEWIFFQIVHNSFLVTVAAALWTKTDSAPPRFERLRGAFLFLAVSIIACTLTAILFTSPLMLFAPHTFLLRHGWTDGIWRMWSRTWLSDFVSIFLIVPVLVIWITNGISWFRGISLKRYAEAGLLALLVLGTSLGAFGWAFGGNDVSPALFLAPLPLLLWAATRFGPTGVCTSLAAVLCISSWCAHTGAGPFAGPDSVEDVISLQLSWILLSVPLLLLVAGIEENKRAVLGLAESEDRFRHLFEQASIGIVLESSEGRFSLVNPAFCSMLGYSEHELLQLNCARLSHPADLELEQPFFEELQKGKGTHYHIEKRFFRKDGSEIWGHVSVSRVNAKDGKPPLVIGMLDDITARKAAEKELRASEARLNSTLNVLTAAIAILDGEGVIIAANASWRKLAEELEMGPRSAGIGANFIERCAEAKDDTPASAREIASRARSLLRGESPRHPFLQRSGGTSHRDYWHLVTMSRFEENGTPRVVISYRDVTDLMRTKEELAQNQESLSLALEATRTVTWQWDFNTGKVWLADKQFSSFVRKRSEVEFSYAELMEQIHFDDRKRVKDAAELAIRDGNSRTVEFRVPNSRGGMRWILTTGKIFHSREGLPAGMLGVNVDITELRQRDSEIHALVGRLIQAQEDERRRISRELHDDFAQRVSLLTNEMELLDQQLSKAGRRTDSLQVRRMRQQAEELSSDLHQMSHELHSSKLQHLGLRTALRDLCDRVSEKHQIKCELHADSIDSELPTDISLCLFRVTQEGLNNVIKHSRAKEVFVDVVQIREKVLLTIKDHGVGFDASTQSSGIGLTSMRERLRSVGGTFAVKSSPNEGTEIIGEVTVRGKLASAATSG